MTEILTIERIMEEYGLSRYMTTRMLIRGGVKHHKGEKWIVTRTDWERIIK